MTKVETRVTITLAQDGNCARLKRVHSGWDALPPDEQGVADTYGRGWGAGLETLREQIETYSSYARGIDLLNTTYNVLDLTAKGRDEQPDWPQDWVHYHDRYKKPSQTWLHSERGGGKVKIESKCCC